MSSSLKRWVTSGRRSTRPEATTPSDAASAPCLRGRAWSRSCDRPARPRRRPSGMSGRSNRRRGWRAFRPAAGRAGGLEGRLGAQCLDRDIDAAPVGHPHDLLDRIAGFEIDRCDQRPSRRAISSRSGTVSTPIMVVAPTAWRRPWRTGRSVPARRRRRYRRC